VQILFSLLLTVPFSARFDEVTDFQRGVYFVALLLAASANIALIAPVAYHRLLFQRARSPWSCDRTATSRWPAWCSCCSPSQRSCCW